MIQEKFTKTIRQIKKVDLEADLVIVGGGMAGVCASITAARAGIRVLLVQDRPVLGGNASSEVRLWILGATSHMGNNNRWAREGGVIDEILLENLYRNKEGNPLVLDTILLEKVKQEANITLLLNTAVFGLAKKSDRQIRSIKAFCSQNSTEYELMAPLFCDASGDGIVGFLSGASFRMGAEPASEFYEGFAPDIEDYGELLGHSIYFYTKDVGYPVKFTAPSFALKDAGKLPRIRNYQLKDHGCRLWWVEYGGRMDTIHQAEDIKWELWKVVYGIFDYIKNSGEFPEAENLTLEWVGTIPGKRESRRFEGDYMLSQKDVVEQREHEDAVAFGGWSLDLHPADGVYSEKMGCNQWHSKGIYQIPYRCYYSKDIENLFLAGRIISASHVAFGSSRVMATCAHGAQAVGMAAVSCKEKNILPSEVYHKGFIRELQNRLNLKGQSIPGLPILTENNLLNSAKAEASSTHVIREIPFDGPWLSLANGAAQMLPLKGGQTYHFRCLLNAEAATELICELRTSSQVRHYSPDISLERKILNLEKGEQYVDIEFSKGLKEDQYAFLTFLRHEKVQIKGSRQRLTGILSLFNHGNKAVSNTGKQEPPEHLGIDSFEFWTPRRRPEGQNIAMQVSPPLEAYSTDLLLNGFTRPYIQSNAWVASPLEKRPTLTFSWPEPQKISQIHLYFDTDFDHPLESSLMGHPENVIPFCVREYTIRDENGKVLHQAKDNHQSINQINYSPAVELKKFSIEFLSSSADTPSSLFYIHCDNT